MFRGGDIQQILLKVVDKGAVVGHSGDLRGGSHDFRQIYPGGDQ